MLHRRNVVTLLSALTLSLGASLPLAAQDAPQKVEVVATFSILGDLARNVGGERAVVTTLVGPDGDAHVYSPTPADARRVSEAKLVIANGLGFEGWIDRLISSSGTGAVVVEVARGVTPLKAGEEVHAHGHGHGHGHAKKHDHAHKHDHAPAAKDAGHHGEYDPHAWQSVQNVIVYVANIRDALIEVDPAGRETYEANAAAYTTQLRDLDAEIKDKVAQLPKQRRKVITTHDAFAYLGSAYGLEMIAPQGVSTESEASAKDVARLIRQIKKEKIGAVFLENVSDPRLAQRIAKETGARIGGTLYSDALSAPGGPAGTYIDMMRHNITKLTEALSS